MISRTGILAITLLVAAPGIAIVAGTSAAHASEGEVIYLDGPAAIAQLRVSHPQHYAAVQRIVASAAEICRPGSEAVIAVASNVNELSCAESLFMTSNPPKRVIRFRLDQTRYVALVAVTDDQPKLLPIRP